MKKSVLPLLTSSLAHLCAKPHPYHSVNNPSRQKTCSLAMQQLLPRVVAIFLLVLVSAGAWAARYAKVTTSVTPTWSGFAYISTSNTIGTATDATQSGNNGSVTTFTFYVKAVPAPGYTFVRWEFVNASGTTSIGSTTSAETTITAQTANSNDGTRNNTIQAVFKEAEGFAGFVFYSGGANGNYLNNSTSGTTSFDPKTCIWTGTSGGRFTNGSYYLRNNSTVITNNLTNASNCAIEETESGTTGARISLSNGGGYYLRYNSGWTRSNSTSQTGGRTVAFAVIKQTGSEVSTAPTITTSDATFTATGSKTYEHSAAAYTMGYNDYIFYNGAHHYWKSDDSEAITGNTKPTAETFTYTWSLSANAEGHVTVNASSGEVSYTKYYDEDTQVTLTLTATSPNKTFTVNKALTFEAPKTDPTGITATIDKSTIYVGETGTVSYTLQGTPCYDNVTFSSSNTSVATVDANTGVVTAKAVGTTTITATAHHYTTGGTDKTATVSVTVKNKVATPVISFEPTPTDGGNTAKATITCATEGAKIYYIVGDGDPTTEYTSAGFSVENLQTVKAIAKLSTDGWDDSDVATATYSKHKVATPTITINNGQVSFSCDEEGDVTYYYTTDGSTPTTGSTEYTEPFTPTSDECTIKVIATMTGAQNSDVAERPYVVQSGISGGTVILNDYEDHNWTYYSDPESPIKSLYPRNVKISYYGNGLMYTGADGGTTTAATGVAVSRYEPENTFVYYKTLERDANNSFPYTLIPNPFSKRPTYNSDGTTKWRGFYKWRVKSVTGGGIYAASTGGTALVVGSLLDAETEYFFRPSDNTATNANNATSMTVELEAVWARAYRVACNANAWTGTSGVASTTLQNNVSYERNFVIINDGTSATTNLTSTDQRPVTVMMVEPDGSDDYRTTTRYIGSAYVNAQNPLKFEWANMRVSSTISANGKNLVLGRGIMASGASHDVTGGYGTPGTTLSAAYINGLGNGTSNGSSSYSSNLDFTLRIESGFYTSVGYISTNNGRYGATSNTIHVNGVWGNDYDRAANNNTRLNSTGMVCWAVGSGAGVTNTSDANDGRETLFLNIKSGYMTSEGDNNNSWNPGNNGLYMGRSGNDAHCGTRRLLFEGGSVMSITGGCDYHGDYNGNNDYQASKDIEMLKMRFMGSAEVRTCAFGGAAQAPSRGQRILILTGNAKVGGWLAGGCNGTSDDRGQNFGKTFIYVGGNAKVGYTPRTQKQYGQTGNGGSQPYCGNVFGAGNGRTSTADNGRTSGEVRHGTNVVIADNSDIERNVYGGGYNGYALNSATVYIAGGTVNGSVFGGSENKWGDNVNITMTGGLVKGGVYGGSNANGTIWGDVTMNINGGQVGTPEAHANVHGGGLGTDTKVAGNVTLNIGKKNPDGTVIGTAVIYGDVYGGSALGQINQNGGTKQSISGDAMKTYAYTTPTAAYNDGTKTTVTLNSGTINGSLYGGALGQKSGVNGATSNIAANVYGPVQVTVNGGSVKGENSAVYGCNNLNGAPQNTVKVDVYKTDAHNAGSDEDDPSDDAYAINAVYGGGNQANYTYTATGQVYPQVTVHNCDNSIKYVYGGGNQATVPGTKVDIYGGNIIGNVFGGGNNANVTTNGTDVNIYGGTILNVYGGNNNGGTITGTINVDVAESKETESSTLCPVNVTDLYGGGNKAASAAGNITIGKCSNISNVYGGANQANVTGDITLNIVDGHIGNVFGGNNNSGNITGAITVNVNWGTGVTAENASLGNVYGGGNLAAYSGSPVVNIKNVTTTGSVFGGGLGKTAIITGDPTVNIGDWATGSVIIGGDVFGGGDLAAIEGSPTVTIRDCDTEIDGDLYGGGNAAPVYSTNTTVWGGHILGNVFGGGNGVDATKNAHGAQVGYKSGDTEIGGSGNTVTNIYGGTIGTWTTDSSTGVSTCQDETGGIFGGSNTNGNIRGTITLNLDEKKSTDTGAQQCTLTLKEVYGAGNQAAYAGEGITFTLGCVSVLGEIYGGAKQADLNGDVHLKITSGHFDRVCGGNNLGGKLNGSIKVTVDETGCNPVTIDELYGGGHLAAYSVYGYNDDGTPKTSGENPKADPEVNIVSCTSIGQVFGGGLGSTAVMVGNPKVNINMIEGKFKDNVSNKWNNKLGTIGEVFGGGNAAKVEGDTYVNIGTQTTVLRADGTTNATVEGVNISGNVYGGGNQADVTGKTHVQVGPTK